MASNPAPRKIYALRDGTVGTRYEFLTEQIANYRRKKQEIEDEIEIMEIERRTAEGHP